MSLIDAIHKAGPMPPDSVPQAEKKRYSELLSHALAMEIAEGLRGVGFEMAKPLRNGAKEKEFQGGLGPKRVDVSFSDEQHGLLLGVSIKSICFQPFGKNLKNRFSDLCTEAVTLHMRFPYSVLSGFFAMPVSADEDVTRIRLKSTFRRATHLFSTISGRHNYTDPGEKFESFTMFKFHGVGLSSSPAFSLISADTGQELSEREFFIHLLDLHNTRNPHAIIEELESEERA
jgi:hypothetical protein